MQTPSPTARNKMRIIHTAHSKYQSSENQKEGQKKSHWMGCGELCWDRRSAFLSCRQQNTSERELEDGKPNHSQPVFVHLGLAARAAEGTPKQLHH